MKHPDYFIGKVALTAVCSLLPAAAAEPNSLIFEPNFGQTHASVQFIGRAPGIQLFVAGSESVFRLVQPTTSREAKERLRAGKGAGTEMTVFRMRAIGAESRTVVTGEDEQATRVHYISGGSAEDALHVSTYARTRIAGVYPGVDMVYYGNGRQLEFDFVVRAGADASRIRLGFDGLEGIESGSDGSLVLKTSAGGMVMRAPVAY